ncbi:hypothetical protein [Streptomyces mirabilis]|uniref:hypothetical protein n=1 Tax=Streptomyces mirabilis TaxID=68239 RepID=UPI0036DCF3AA
MRSFALRRGNRDSACCAAVRSADLARFTLETSALAQCADDPERAVDAAFDLLEHGWSTPAPRFGDGHD